MTLEIVEKQAERITKVGTWPLDCMGVNTRELSMALESFSCSWISDKLYKKSNSVCGGKPADGFEIWQRVRAD